MMEREYLARFDALIEMIQAGNSPAPVAIYERAVPLQVPILDHLIADIQIDRVGDVQASADDVAEALL